jgi:peptidoglycan/xylan/chitin deacetylase (PgdA/CDA1 family)
LTADDGSGWCRGIDLETDVISPPARTGASLLLAIIILFGAIPVLHAQETPLVVTGASGVNIRDCADFGCDLITTALLGETVYRTGEPEGAFTPVRYGDVEGYAFSLYLVAPGADLLFREGAPGCSRIALIFDVGVGYSPSQAVLNTLVETGTAATMFVMGSFANAQPAYLQQLHNAGFPIATHGHDAVDLTTLGPDQIRWDLNTSMEAIESVIGEPPHPWHTPYAAGTNSYVRSIIAGEGVMPVGWNVAATDYTWSATGDTVYNDIVPKVYDGAIVEMHLDAPATEQSTALALPRIIEDLSAEGYQFVTISELMLPCEAMARA